MQHPAPSQSQDYPELAGHTFAAKVQPVPLAPHPNQFSNYLSTGPYYVPRTILGMENVTTHKTQTFLPSQSLQSNENESGHTSFLHLTQAVFKAQFIAPTLAKNPSPLTAFILVSCP